MIKLNKILEKGNINPPTNLTKRISIIAIISFCIGLFGGAYGIAISKKKLNQNDFTISNAIANGDKYIMIIFFSISYISMVYLNYLRSKNFLFEIRILLLTLIVSLIIVIMWITVEKDKNLHYILAGIIFTSNVILLLIISYIFSDYLKQEKNYKTYLLDIIILMTFFSWIVLLVYGIFTPDRDEDTADEEVFAIAEITTVVLTSLPLLYLGFI